jgi:hypothetical protein
MFGRTRVGNVRNIATAILTSVVLAAGAAAPGCFTSKACGLVWCRDQFHATVASADGSIPSGTHLLEVTADGVTISCTFQIPLAMQPRGGTVAPRCPTGLEVFIGQESTCTETTTGSNKSLSCVPIPGRFFEDITVTGKPAQVLVRLSVDGAVVLDRIETPGYVSSEPNGPGCDPTCQQASAQWMLSAP